MSIPNASTAESSIQTAKKAARQAQEQRPGTRPTGVRGKLDPFLAIFLAKAAASGAAAPKTPANHLLPGKLVDARQFPGKGHQTDHSQSKPAKALSDALAALKPSQTRSQLVLVSEEAAPAASDGKKKTQSRTSEAKPAVAAPVNQAMLGLLISDLRKVSAEAASAAAPVSAGSARSTRTASVQPRVVVVDLRKKPSTAPASASNDAQANLRRLSASERDSSSILLHRLDADKSPAPAGPTAPRDAQPLPRGDTIQRLRDMAGSEVLKAANMVVRDGGGEIRLVLKPESLGSVRIKMNLVDNSIEGRIIVDNPAVKQILDGSLDSLIRAFTADGFQNASVQVSVGGQGMDQGRSAQEPPSMVRRRSVEGFEGSVPGIQDVSLGDLLVNLFV